MWNSFLRLINQTMLNIMMLFLGIMTVVIFFQIVSRTFFGFSFSWTEELARFLMIWVIFLGAAIAFQYGAHISIDLLVSLLPFNVQKMMQVLIALLSTFLLFVLFFKGIEISKMMMVQKSPALEIPMGYVYAIIPISAVLQLLNIIDTTMNYLITGRVREEEF